MDAILAIARDNIPLNGIVLGVYIEADAIHAIPQVGSADGIDADIVARDDIVRRVGSLDGNAAPTVAREDVPLRWKVTPDEVVLRAVVEGHAIVGVAQVYCAAGIGADVVAPDSVA